ncbi:uncharacterized protein PHA67_024416 [Liasis olivaceus]
MSKTGSTAEKGTVCFRLPEEQQEDRKRQTPNSETRTSRSDSDMIKLLFLLSFMTAIEQNRILGKPVHGDFSSMLQAEFSDLPPEWQNKRNSYYATQDSEDPNVADPTSLCYFIQESETESQISCRLRFTRSRFNFNSFGLRFGKRQESPLADDGQLGSRNSGKIMETLPKSNLERRLAWCEDNWEDNC